MFRKTILGLAILALAPAVARAQFRTGYTYHMVGDSTMYYCNAPEKKITHHLHMWLYVANDRDLFAFFDATHGLQFDLAKARKKGGQAAHVSYSYGGERRRYAGRITVSNDRLTLTVVGTNDRGGRRRFLWDLSATGTSCQALGYEISPGGCGHNPLPGDVQELGDGRIKSCDVYPGRPRTNVQ